MTDLVEKVARAIAGELGKQDFGEPFELHSDLKIAYLDQGEVDFAAVARAAIEATGIEQSTLEIKELRGALEPFSQMWKGPGRKPYFVLGREIGPADIERARAALNRHSSSVGGE